MARGRPPVRKQQVKAWLERQRQTDPNAWLTMTYKEIGMDVCPGEVIDPATIRNILPMLVADQCGILPSEAIKRKAEYRKSVEGFFTADKEQLLKGWRSQDPPIPIEDCAYRLDISLQQVRNKCKELGLS